jgi:hypothetical protein
MHFTIQYKRLTPPQKVKIYKNLLDKVSDRKIAGTRSKLYSSIEKQLCRRNEMNGRQIRNIVSMGLALANDRGDQGEGDARLTMEDLLSIYEMTLDSLLSLKDVTAKAQQRNEAEEDTELNS